MTAQRMEALERANHVRLCRKDLRIAVERGQVPLVTLLLHRDQVEVAQVLRTMAILPLLRWAPKVGKVKAARLCRGAQVGPLTKVSDVTDRQLRAILDFLPRGTSEGATTIPT